MEFEIDPSSGRYLKRRLKTDPHLLSGYAGLGQELWVPGLGVVLCSLFAYEGEVFMRIGGEVWKLFQPGLRIAHTDGIWRSRLTLLEPGGRQVTFRYKRKDFFLFIIYSTYDALDSELANLPAALPSWAEVDKADLVARWSAPAQQAVTRPP